MIEFLQLVIFFSPLITAFALIAFSPLRQLSQPFRFIVLGFTNGLIAALVSGLGILLGILRTPAFLFIVAASIPIGAFSSLLASSETISRKKKTSL
jgi:hypothetical protein